MLNKLFIPLLLLNFYNFSAYANQDLCDQINQAQGSHNSADYQEGIDVHGNAVVSADLNEKNNYFKHSIKIPVTIDLVEYFDESLPDGLQAEQEIMFVEITHDGKVIYSNQDFTAETVALCEQKQLQTNTSDSVSAIEEETQTIKVDDEEDEDLIWGEAY